MALVKTKPTSAGRRHLVKVVNSELHKGKPLLVCWRRSPRLVVVTTTAVLLPVTLAVVTSTTTVSLTSNVTKMVFLLLLSVWNTIRTVAQTSHC